MFAKLVITALLAVSSILAQPISDGKSSFPTKGGHYARDAKLLEPYNSWLGRFEEFDCAYEFGSTFYDACCHPLLKGKLASSLPKECKANYCDEPSTSKPHSASGTHHASTHHASPTSHKATTTKKASNPKPTGSGGYKYSGKATYFFQKGKAGACGNKNKDSTPLVALQSHMYKAGGGGWKSGYCGRHVEIRNKKNGKTVTAIVADECPTCVTAQSLDLSEGAFMKIGDKKTGMLDIEWKFV